MGLSMTVSGDEPIKRFVYDSPDFSIICRADLLTLDSVPDAEANSHPAHYVAQLYERQGDSFVRDLRGTFAIILYDKKLRALKAWTDHFGAQRLVFTSPRGDRSCSRAAISAVHMYPGSENNIRGYFQASAGPSADIPAGPDYSPILEYELRRCERPGRERLGCRYVKGDAIRGFSQLERSRFFAVGLFSKRRNR